MDEAKNRFDEIIKQLGSHYPKIVFAGDTKSVFEDLRIDREYRFVEGAPTKVVINGLREDDNSVVMLAKRLGDLAETYAIKLPKLKYLVEPEESERRKVEIVRRRIKEQAGREFEHVREKLREVKTAICISDRAIVHLKSGEFVATAQKYIPDTSGLDDWLNEQSSPFGGLEFGKWLDIAQKITKPLNDIHKKRVPHGDFYEKNILIRRNEEGRIDDVFLIDFADSFIHEDSDGIWPKKQHPYLAPERINRSLTVPNESSDVYSLGVVLLNLATGRILDNTSEIPEFAFQKEKEEWKRRKEVRAFLKDNEKTVFLREKPKAADLISKCISYSQSERPTASDVLEELRSYDTSRPSSITAESIRLRLSAMQKTLDKLDSKPTAYLRILDRQLKSMEQLLEGCDELMVDVKSSRDKLMTEVCDLLDNLERGDTWTSVSLPSIWQDRALGLNDRAFTSSILAVKREANLHRGFVLSMEDIGEELWKAWDMLLSTYYPKLYERFTVCCDSIKRTQTIKDAQTKNRNHQLHTPDPKALNEAMSPSEEKARTLNNLRDGSSHLQHLENIISAYRDAFKSFGTLPSKQLKKGAFKNINSCKGLYLGFLPVYKNFGAKFLRYTDPFVLIQTQKQWMLLQGHFRELEISREANAEARPSRNPELVSLRLFRSIRANGVPDSRIESINKNLGLSINCAANDWEFHESLKELIAHSKNMIKECEQQMREVNSTLAKVAIGKSEGHGDKA